jgi:2-octaprenyl-6-methoxyphenol hydroxylase
MTSADVVIGGGGIVGLSLGLALARGGLSVVVADPVAPVEAQAEAFDGRVSALSFATARMFRALGLWDDLGPKSQPIHDILVTDAKLGDAPSPFSLHFDHAELGTPLGYIAENRSIRQALFAGAQESERLTLVSPASLDSLAVHSASVTAKLSNGDEVKAPLAIAADGRESPLRTAMGIGVVRWAYPQTGIVATVHHEKPHKGVAYEHFLPSGPFAILPMTGDRSSLVWTEREELAPAMMSLPQAEFDAEIGRRFGSHLGPTHAEGSRWCYPLRFHLARDYVKPRFALAGDAAHGIHPIAGQGLNLGLKDAAALADVVLDAARMGRDIGGLDVLARYERWRRFDSLAMAAATDGLNRLFSNDVTPLRFVRDVGMGVVDQIGPLRRFFMRHAGGDVGRLPSLMRTG